MRLGITTWAYETLLTNDNLEKILNKIACLNIPGKPIIEFLLVNPENQIKSAKAIKERAAFYGFSTAACGFNPAPNPHMPSKDEGERKAATERAKAMVNFAAAIAVNGDPGILAGPLHVQHKFFTGHPLSDKERGYLVKGLKEVAKEAESRNVFVGLELLNRFETYVLNTVDSALPVFREVGSPNIGGHFDTSHAHMEESDLIGSLEKLAKADNGIRLVHFHLSENDRGDYTERGPLGRQALQVLQCLKDNG